MIAYIHDPKQYADEGGVYFPIVICDACVRPIQQDGNVYWLVHDDGEIDPRIWHTHKHPCSEWDREIERCYGRPGSLVMSEELRRWLNQLQRNFQRLPAFKRMNRTRR